MGGAVSNMHKLTDISQRPHSDFITGVPLPFILHCDQTLATGVSDDRGQGPSLGHLDSLCDKEQQISIT
jgi:hypothetical protein